MRTTLQKPQGLRLVKTFLGKVLPQTPFQTFLERANSAGHAEPGRAGARRSQGGNAGRRNRSAQPAQLRHQQWSQEQEPHAECQEIAFAQVKVGGDTVPGEVKNKPSEANIESEHRH